MISRRKAREQIVQILFQIDMGGLKPLEAMHLFEKQFNRGRPLSPFAREVVCGVTERREDLDRLLEAHSANWRVDRMSLVDRNVLRMALYELLFVDEIPPKVSINEAIDLGKKFGSADSGAFINGILDSIYRSLQAEEKDSSPGNQRPA